MRLETITGSCQDWLFAGKRFVLGPARVRRSRLYCLGAPKSGTHSIAAMFSKNVRARHHADALALIDRIVDWRGGRLSEAAMVEYLHGRDRRFGLEVDSAPLNFELLDLLLREFPDARFVLTLRDCYSWLNSFANHMVRSEGATDVQWIRMRELRFRPADLQYAPEEQWLKEKGFYSLDGYFSYWARHGDKVLSTVPADRLLIVKTNRISASAPAITDFAGLPRRSIRAERTHAYRNTAKQEFIRKFDRAFLEAKVEQHCRPLMQRFFPEIKSLDDASL